MKRVLFVCTANAARSQMAEAVLRNLRPDDYEVFSAGTQPSGVDPRALRALRELNIETKGLRSKPLEQFQGQSFDYVIALCDKAEHECQHLSSAGTLISWDFDDPQSSSDPRAFSRTLREILQRIQMFLLVTEKKAENAELRILPSFSPAELFKCLADVTRAKMALLIQREGELCVWELTCAMGESQPKISRHLAQLRNAGLLADRRQGQWVYYRLHSDLPDWVKQILETTREANGNWLKEEIERLETMGDRPVRVESCC
jgi:protein-tyrosine-phosphatase/DNA-binding transcriptional ArsR family regulator